MWEGKLVGIMLVVNQVLNVGANTLSKAAMARGLSNFVFITYAHVIAFFFLLPFTFFFHGKTPAPPITYSITLRLFLLGFICYSCSIFLFIGIRYSSPTLASAMSNLSPAFTFILAIIFRMEVLKMRSQSGLLKIMGTMASIGGAFIVIFYQGSPIAIPPTSSPSGLKPSPLLPLSAPQPASWIVGGFLLLTSSIFLSLIYIVKTWIVRDFPSEVLVTQISCFFETVIAASVALIFEGDTSIWIPSFDLKFIAIVIGAVECGVGNTVQTWACRKKGPVFAVMFKPLQMIIAVIMGISFLKDTLYLGSVIGGLITALGFYIVMKGNAGEEMLKKGDGHDVRLSCSDPDSSSHEAPLLHPIRE